MTRIAPALVLRKEIFILETGWDGTTREPLQCGVMRQRTHFRNTVEYGSACIALKSLEWLPLRDRTPPGARLHPAARPRHSASAPHRDAEPRVGAPGGRPEHHHRWSIPLDRPAAGHLRPLPVDPPRHRRRLDPVRGHGALRAGETGGPRRPVRDGAPRQLGAERLRPRPDRRADARRGAAARQSADRRAGGAPADALRQPTHLQEGLRAHDPESAGGQRGGRHPDRSERRARQRRLCRFFRHARLRRNGLRQTRGAQRRRGDSRVSHCGPTREQRYVLRFYPPVPMTGDAARDTQALQAQLEAVIRAYPDQWLWIHRRWKTRPAGEPSLYESSPGVGVRPL